MVWYIIEELRDGTKRRLPKEFETKAKADRHAFYQMCLGSLDIVSLTVVPRAEQHGWLGEKGHGLQHWRGAQA